MKIYFDEQDVANAICVFVADLESMNPANVQIEFRFHEDEGVNCYVKANQLNFLYEELQISNAIGFYLDEIHRFSSHAMDIKIGMDVDEGITSEVIITYP